MSSAGRRGIGVFDSGLGGLTVAREVLRRLPNEPLIYFADNAYVPYGPRPMEQIREFAEGIIRFLDGQGAKVIIAGCNMSSAILWESGPPEAEVPIVELLSGAAREAALVTRNRRVGVIATEGTVASGAYPGAIWREGPDVEVFQQACPSLVPLVEQGELESKGAVAEVERYLAPLLDEGIDTLVLGCTHYPLLEPVIRRIAGDEVRLVDPAHAVAERVVRMAGIGGTQETSPNGRPHLIFASGNPAPVAAFARTYLGLGAVSTARVDAHAQPAARSAPD